MTYTNFESMPMVIEVMDIAETLNIGRNKAYELVSSGKIKALRVGHHYRIPREAFISFIKNSLAEEE